MEIKDLLESEDGKAALTKAVEEETLGLKAKRDELLEANRKLRNELADRQGEMSKSAAKLALAETTVQKLLVDNGLTEALTQAKVAPEFLEAARALIKSREEIGIGESEGKPVALIGEQALAGFVEDWARSEQGRAFIAPAGNSGGGAGWLRCQQRRPAGKPLGQGEPQPGRTGAALERRPSTGQAAVRGGEGWVRGRD